MICICIFSTLHQSSTTAQAQPACLVPAVFACVSCGFLFCRFCVALTLPADLRFRLLCVRKRQQTEHSEVRESVCVRVRGQWSRWTPLGTTRCSRRTPSTRPHTFVIPSSLVINGTAHLTLSPSSPPTTTPGHDDGRGPARAHELHAAV